MCMETFDIYFARHDGRAAFKVRKVKRDRSDALAHPAPEGYSIAKVRRAPHRLGLRGYK